MFHILLGLDAHFHGAGIGFDIAFEFLSRVCAIHVVDDGDQFEVFVYKLVYFHCSESFEAVY